ncbi:MAG: cache domain-containing protein [Desulfosporosinus sp.]|nr:cache domain-containing protein [Desulfosporosinus sp.]
MRSFKHQILILLLSSLVILAASFFVVLGGHMKDRDAATASIKTQADLATCGEIIDLKYPGSWLVRDGELYKGPIKISSNNDLVDHLSQLTGDTVTIFQGEMRVATTARGSNGEREIGTRVSAKVAKTVLQDGQTYLGDADTMSPWSQVGYVPIRAESGMVIGMVYMEVSHAYEQEFFTRSLTTVAILGLILTVLVVLFIGLFFKNEIIYPLQTIVLGTREAASSRFTPRMNVSVVQEIEEMKDAVKLMAEQIQTLTGESNRVTPCNLQNDPPENKINTVVELMRDSETINEPTIDPTIATPLKSDLSLDSPWYNGTDGLPKGLSKVTLDHIIQFLQVTRRPLSAEEVAEGVKLTRVTVRHYLEFLEQCRVLKSELRYGTGGRPVKLFILL